MIFSTPSIEGVIGYRIVFNYAIVVGDPVCAPDVLMDLVHAFQLYCVQQHLMIAYLSASESCMSYFLSNCCSIAIHIGEEVIINPSDNHLNSSGPHARLLRKKYNHALKSGVLISEYNDYNESLEKQIDSFTQSWMHSRTGIQMYLSEVNPFANRTNKRWFYAYHAQKIIGVAIINRLDFYQGWVINMAMTSPSAPSGTSECMILTLLETLRQEHCSFLSIGTTPALNIERLEGLGPATKWFVRSSYLVAKKCLSWVEDINTGKNSNPH